MWCQRAQSYKTQKETLQVLFRSKIKEFIENSISQIEQERVLINQNEQIQQKLENQLEKAEKNHNKLLKWRNQRILDMKADIEKRDEEMRQELLLEKQKQEREELKRSAIKEKIEEYHQHLLNENNLLKNITKEMAFKEQAEKIVRKRLNEERILYREGKRQDKIKARQKELESKLNSNSRYHKAKRNFGGQIRLFAKNSSSTSRKVKIKLMKVIGTEYLKIRLRLRSIKSLRFLNLIGIRLMDFLRSI